MSYEIKGTVIIDDDRNIIGANTYNGYVPVNPTLTISAANGLVGGGSLAANRSFYVRAGDGVTVNTTGVHVVGGDGISTNTSSVFVDNNWMKTRYTSLVSAEGSGNTLQNNIGLGANTFGATAFWHSQGNRPSDAPYNAQGGGIAVGSGLWSSPGIIHFSGTNLSYSPPSSSTWRTIVFSDDLTGFANSNVQIVAGNGLTGGGALTSNRTLAVGQGDGITVGATTVGVDATVIRTTGNQTLGGTKTFTSPILGPTGSATLPSHSFSGDTGTGIFSMGSGSLGFTGGGTISAAFTATGNLRLYNTGGTFYTEISNQPTANRTLTMPDANVVLVSGTMVPNSIQVISGNGLSGGGTLAANITLAVTAGDGIVSNTSGVHVNTTVVRNTRTITAGNGLAGGGDLSANRSFAVGQGDGISVNTTAVSVDSTVMRLANEQTVTGTKSFFSNDANNHPLATAFIAGRIATQAISTHGGDGGNYITSMSPSTNQKNLIIQAYDTVSNTVVQSWSFSRTTGEFTSESFAGSGASITNLNATALATGTVPDARIASSIARSNIQVIAGNGLTGGGDLTANRTLTVGQGDGITVAATTVGVDSTVVRTSGNQTIGGTKTFSSAIAGSITGSAASLTTDRTLTIGSTGKTFNGTANVAWTLAEIGAAPTIGSTSITTLGTITTGTWNAGAITSSGTIAAANGTAAAPAFDFSSDPNTGMYLSGADTIGFATNGVIAAAFTSTGNLRLYNTGGTFYTEIANQPTANRTLTLPADGNTVLVAGTMVPNTIQVIAGNGLSGGGTLAANRTLTVGAGDGISVNTTAVGVDSTVVRTTGAQDIAGIKDFSDQIRASNTDGLRFVGASKSIIHRMDGATYWTLIADTPTGTYNALRPFYINLSTGLVTMANGLNWGNTAAIGNGASLTTLNGSNITTGTVADARIATTLVRNSIQVIAGNGLTGGGTLAANRTLAVGAGNGITVAATSVSISTDYSNAKGGGNDSVFFENDATVTTSYTITTGRNAMTAGPVTINNGVTVTIPDGQAWSVV